MDGDRVVRGLGSVYVAAQTFALSQAWAARGSTTLEVRTHELPVFVSTPPGRCRQRKSERYGSSSGTA